MTALSEVRSDAVRGGAAQARLYQGVGVPPSGGRGRLKAGLQPSRRGTSPPNRATGKVRKNCPALSPRSVLRRFNIRGACGLNPAQGVPVRHPIIVTAPKEKTMRGQLALPTGRLVTPPEACEARATLPVLLVVP